jgi:L-fuculose-phosphate aldolase
VSHVLIEASRALEREGLNPGTSGNLSVRERDGMWITPSGMAPAELAPDDLVWLTLDGGRERGSRAPSSEWPMHAAIYREFPDTGGVVHCHSPYATTLACARRGIPPLHYMLAVAAADEIPCVEYATYGSEALAREALRGLRGRRATLLANHGQIARGVSLGAALRVAREVEVLARLYWGTLAIGGPTLLEPSELREVVECFESYGQPDNAVSEISS